MNYFQEYEKLKATNQLITPGSIWRDRISYSEVKVNYVTETEVNFQCLSEMRSYDYVKSSFLRHFRRCIAD